MIRWSFSESAYLTSSGKIIQEGQLYAYAMGEGVLLYFHTSILLKSTYSPLIYAQQTSSDSTIQFFAL